MTNLNCSEQNLYVFSSGGGVQSTAALVLSANRKINYPIHVFANVGDRAENPKTIDYINNFLKPYAAANNILWVDICRRTKNGSPVDLLDTIEQKTNSIPIPVRMSGSGAPGNRVCTVDFKIKPVAKYLKGLAKENPTKRIILGKGISIDEARRAKPESGFPHYDVAYPLIDLQLNRLDCFDIIRKAGLPPAPKSSCWFCPYKNKRNWQEMRDYNLKFTEAVALEKMLHQRSVDLGRGGCYFTSTGTSKELFLDEVTSPHFQGDLFHGFDDQECDSGYCWV